MAPSYSKTPATSLAGMKSSARSHHDFTQMLIARRCFPRCARTVTPATFCARHFAATAVSLTNDPDDEPPRTRARPRATDESIESYVRTIRDQWGHNIPAGLLSPDGG